MRIEGSLEKGGAILFCWSIGETVMEKEKSLVINGLHVDRELLEVHPFRVCDIASCHGVCCSRGVWLTLEEKTNVLRHAHAIKSYLPVERQDEQLWFEGNDEQISDLPSGHYDATRVVPQTNAPYEEACIFLLPDARCALQVAAVSNGIHPWALKPFFCAIYPLVVNKGWLEIDDQNDLYELDACRRCSTRVEQPLYLVMRNELVKALGEDGYRQLCQLASSRGTY
jgi:Fe-S-cluster containining protein